MKLRKLLLKMLLSIKGVRIFRYFNNFLRSQYLPLEQLLDYQRSRLSKLLIHAYKNVPYYQKILRESGVVNSYKQVNLEYFSELPVLTKNIIRANYDNLKSQDIEARKYFYNTSGGSTGQPIKLIQDSQYWDTKMAGKWLFYTFTDKYPGEKVVLLWGAEKDVLRGSIGFKAKFKNFIFNRTLLNTFRMTTEDMYGHIDVINKKRPKIITAYVQSIFELARFISDNNIKIYSPRGIITSAGTLYNENKELIEKVFQTKVYDRYGSREVGDVACSCQEDKGLHVNIFNHYLEILNDQLKPCQPGETGRVYVTVLNNYSMPLIRYDIGDLAVPADNVQCSCGRGLPLIAKVIGRVNSMIRTENGVFDSVAISTLLYYFKDNVPFQSFSKYQIIQKTKNEVVIKIVVTDRERWGREKSRIEEKFRKTLGSGVGIIIQEVDNIAPAKSGKFAYVISEVNE